MDQPLAHVKQYEQAAASGDRAGVARLFQAWREEIWRVTCFGTWFQGPLVDIREEHTGVSFAIAVEDDDVTLTIRAPFRRFDRAETSARTEEPAPCRSTPARGEEEALDDLMSMDYILLPFDALMEVIDRLERALDAYLATTCLSSAHITRIKEIVERLVAMNSWAAELAR